MKRLLGVAFIVSTAASQRSIHACAVCFGGDNADLLRAYNWGILLLLSFTFIILGSLAVAVYKLETARQDGELPSER